MTTLQRILFSVLLFVLAPSSQGGTYPAGRSATQAFDFPAGTVDLGDGSSLGSDGAPPGGGPVAMIIGAALRLTDRNTPNSVGSFKLPDLDPANVVRSFDVSFSVAMDKDSGALAGEGWSINFGRVPNDNGTGEGGFAPLSGGLTIAFDTLDGGSDPTSVEVSVGGVSIANFPRTFIFGPASRVIAVHWDQVGLDVTYDGKAICADLPTPGFNPGPGNIFAFTARTTDSGMDTIIDNLKGVTQALPVIETGGPIISEFVANNSEFEDEFADKPGWIELMNGSATSADLTGWYLTDAKDNLTKWRIPRLTLSPYNYEVVFASGRDRQLAATSFLHSAFTLARSGGYVALVRPDGKTVASAYEYGPQQKGVGYGEQGVERKRGYMFPASPGMVNTQEPAPASFGPDVEYSHGGGFVSEPLSLTLSVPEPAGVVLRYTIDRTEPGASSPIYSVPISITKLTVIRARAFAPGHLPGRVTSRMFVMMDASLLDYSGVGKVFDSNLPLVFLDSFGVSIDGSTGGSRPFRPSLAVVIQPDPRTGRASLTSPPDYVGPAGVHLRGESSIGFDQRSYAFEIWDETAKDLDVGLLGMPADSDWVLYGPWSEKTLMRNKLIFDWMRMLRGNDGSAVRSRFIELFFNQTFPVGGRVGYASYRGIYLLMEKMKRGKDRLPLEGLNDKTVDPELIRGGYIFRTDKVDALKNNWSSSSPYGIPLQSFDPDRLNTTQLNYLKGYVNAFEAALKGANFRDPRTGYRAFLDPDIFIDAQWMVEISKQVDGYVFSTYFHKDRAGRLRAGPLWDFNISLGNADYATGDRATGWLYDVANGVGQLWYPRLHADPDYKLAHWDRYWEMRRSFLANDAVASTINGQMATLLDGYSGGVSNRAPANIQNPVARHFRRWPRLGVRDWPNPPAETKIKTWQEEVTYMKDWLKTRLEWLDDQSARVGTVVYRPPVISHGDGRISTAVQWTVEPFSRVASTTKYATGDIYFTTDNSDPRLSGGAISASAVRYIGPVTIGSSLTLKARLYSQGQWSPLAASTFLRDAVAARSDNLVVSEILYRPAPLTPSEISAGIVDPVQLEFLELRNISKRTVDLTGVRFSNGLEFDFGFAPTSSRMLKPGESGVLVRDVRAFSIRYPQVPLARVLGQLRGRLDNGGETIGLTAADGSVIKEFRYDNVPPWPVIGESGGQSLVLRDPAANPDLSQPSSWAVSAKTGGTPGSSGLGADTFGGDPRRDSDGDGVIDLFEFVSGSDPENPGSRFPIAGTLRVWSLNGADEKFFSFDLTRALGVRGVTTILEVSKDLGSWGSASAGLELASSRTNADGTVTDTYRTLVPVPKSGISSLFFRVLVRVD